MSAPRPSQIAAIPTLTPERDPLPERCQHCGSRALEGRAALGGEWFGTVACLRCGTTAAYVRAPVVPRGQRRQRHVPEDALPPPEPSAKLRARAAGFSRVGRCTPSCTPERGHDYLGHEARILVLLARAPLPSPIVRTGPLAVDLDARSAYLEGRGIALPRRGMDALLALAWIRGEAVPWEMLTRDELSRHTLRVTIARLRARLGPAGPLVVTVPDYGYRLQMTPYTGPEELTERAIHTLARRPWARAWDACRLCGTTDRMHRAHGYCRGCWWRQVPRVELPRGRPPAGRWALAWDACRACGTTDRKHKTHGYCTRCQRLAGMEEQR